MLKMRELLLRIRELLVISLDVPVPARLVMTILFLFGAIMTIIASGDVAPGIFARLLQTAGSALMVSIPGYLIYRIIHSLSTEEKQRALLERLSREHRDAVRDHVDNLLPVVRDKRIFGLDRIIPSMDFNALFDDLETGDELYWLDTYAPPFLQFQNSIEDALRRGAILNFLVISGHSSLLEMRAIELGTLFDPKKFANQVAEFVDMLHLCQQHTKTCLGKLRIAFYDDLLGSPMYVVIKGGKAIYCYSSMYLSRPTGVKLFPHFRWTPGEPEDRSFLHFHKEYILAKWEKSWRDTPPQNASGNTP